MSEKTITYTANDRAIVAALKGADHPLTLAEINEKSGLSLKPGSMTSAIRKGLIVKGDDVKVKRPVKREVSTYVFVTADVLNITMDGKPIKPIKPFNYTPSELAILATAATMPKGEPFTLAELAAAHRAEIKSGNINSLVKKGNLAKAGTRKIECEGSAKVATYMWCADVPSDNGETVEVAAEEVASAETTPNI